MKGDRAQRLKFLLAARGEGFRLVRVNPWNYVLRRESQEFGRETFNFYWNKRGRSFAVQTTIDHPKKGRNQLNRKPISLETAIQLLENPRKHTGRGYYKK